MSEGVGLLRRKVFGEDPSIVQVSGTEGPEFCP